MPDTHYSHPRLAALYDLTCPWSRDRDFYLSQARSKRMRILEIGCGTGLLCRAYARQGHRVTGVDPAASMLEVAKRKPSGAQVDWVHASAQTFRSDKRFDLIVMTGHAFQVLLNDVDMLMAFATMRSHLAPGGVAVFESRNPDFDWVEVWDEDSVINLRGETVHQSCRLLSLENDRLTFDQRYRFADADLVSRSVLRFPSRAHIEAGLAASELTPDAVLGDWHGGPLDAETSREMIFVVRASD